MAGQIPSEDLQCSFCGKSRDEVRKLISGPKVYICDECIALCNDILAEEWPEDVPPSSLASPPSSVSVHGSSATFSARCTLCSFPSPREHLTTVPDRGFLCDACVDAIRAASKRDSQN